MTEFQQKGYVLVKNFIDPDSVRTISRYLENCIEAVSRKQPRRSVRAIPVKLVITPTL
jgi:hypothetical protein